ncbi:nose resistant to fluoxetine protein 6 [Parasteatoda tepidariorum]|uniref:nose resistant to fluoxetine protein 6 n=1 Tax=Parasteatoda tepidariorum TaxID=114398 RepID=UPI00077FD666|nr:nose resistant to fluoxetine protein 6 [Parasteatoda tepidariorum]
MLIACYVVLLFSINFSNFVTTAETSSEGIASTTESPKIVKKTETGLQGKLKEMMDSISKQIFPYAVKLGTTSKASTSCKLDLMVTGMAAQRMAPWSLKMIDSFGKLSGGMLEGITSALGDYDECLDVIIGGKKKRKFRTGTYCMLEIKPPDSILTAIKEVQINKNNSLMSTHLKDPIFQSLRRVRTNPDHIMFRLGICMPSSCSVNDVQNLIDTGIDIAEMKGRLPVHVSHCDAKVGYYYQPHEILIFCLIGVFLIIAVIGTIVAFLKNIWYSDKDSNSNVETKGKFYGKENLSIKERAVNLCSKFSVGHSISKLLCCDNNNDASDVCKGMTFFNILFSIFLHTYALPHPLHLYRFRDTLNFTKFIDEILFGAVANSSVGIDTFFFLGGFYFVNSRWKNIKRPNILPYILKFIFMVVIRMIFAQVLVGCLLFLLPSLGSGPLWKDFVESPVNNCKKSWWMNLLFIQNFLGPYDICLYQSWFFPTMVHVFIITAVLVYALHRWPFGGVVSTVTVIVISVLVMALVTAITGYPATLAVYFYDYRTSIYFWKYVYTQFYTHIGSQCIGMLTAYFIAEYPIKKLDKRLVLLAWLASLLTMSSIVLGLYDYRDGAEMSRSLAVFYAAFHRPAWALVIGWIIYACATGYGGVVNSFLTWKAFMPLERLSYLAYLLHIPIMYYHGGVQRERMYMGHYNQLMCFLAYAVLSYALAFVCYIIFQAPYEIIEGCIFNKSAEENMGERNSTSVSEIKLQKTSSEVTVDEEENKLKVFNSRY